MKRRILPVLAALGVWLAPATIARAQSPGPYFGASYGQYDIEENALDETDTPWKAFIGTRVSPAFALEFALVNVDRAVEQASSFEADGWSAAGVLSLPLGTNSALYTRPAVFGETHNPTSPCPP